MRYSRAAIASLAFFAHAFLTTADSLGTSMPQEPDSELAKTVANLQQAIDAAVAKKGGDELKAQLAALRIPQPEAWFKAAFVDETNEKLNALYLQTFSKSEDRFVVYASTLARPGWKLVATVSSGGAQPQTTALLQQADDSIRRSLKHPIMFFRLDYDLGSGSPRGIQPQGYLIEIDGHFRFLGNTIVQAIPGVPAVRIRQGGAVSAASLISRIQPQYPASAREKGVSGNVRLHIVIGTDGAVKQIEVMSGDPLLQQAAVDAVRQWRYRQTLLNGEPVEVDTTIDVIFSF